MKSLPHKLTFASTAVFCLWAALNALAQIPAFPGAEGFGAYATGGRGGDVYTVVNLNSSGPGSLRYGVETAPPSGRTIVFAVSGYIPINYNSDTRNQTVRIVQNKVTIAGQTAPGDGIGLKDGRILMTGNNLVLRHLRIRHGKYGGAGDCLNLESTADNSIIDHISLMFSTDENISFFNSTLDNFTMQYSTSSWGMERHNAGGLWDLQDGTCHHTLWAHHRTRNPKARPFNGVLEWINNVTYDWRSEGFIMGDSQTPANWSANVRGCYYLSILDYEFGIDDTPLSKARIASDGLPNFHLYLDNCLHDSNTNGLLDGIDKGYSIVSGQPYNPAEGAAPGTERYGKSLTPFAGATGLATVNIDNPLTAYKKVLSSSGALRLDANYTGPLRDELDSLLIQSIENQESILVAKDTPRTPTADHPEYINDPPSNGEALLAGPPYNISSNGFGTLNTAPAPLDTDLDGMPDFWENSLGWNPNAQDHNTAIANAGGLVTGLTFFPSNTVAGYTRLEEYLHFKAIPHASIEKNTTSEPSSLSVDLRRYVRGFNKAPVTFTLSNVTNGTAVIQPDGYTVVFTPTLNYFGRARFDFKVTDGDGSTWTQTLGVLVSGVNVPRNLKWKGDGSANVWDMSATNFLTGVTPVTFRSSDNVLFDDTGFGTPQVSLGLAVTPSVVEVNATQNYAIGGVGALDGAMSLTKSGPGTLTLGNTNSFTGGINLNQGTIMLSNNTFAGGYGPINLNGGTLILAAPGGPALFTNVVNVLLASTVKVLGSGFNNVALSGPVSGTEPLTFDVASGGTFSARSGMVMTNYSGTISLNNSGYFRWQGGTGSSSTAFDLGSNGNMQTRDGGTITLGSLTGGAGSFLRGAGSTSSSTTYLIGGKNWTTTFPGTITNGVVSGTPVATAITKLGSGTLNLTGNNNYTGTTTVGTGKLVINGNNGPSAVVVSNGATLGGSGTIGGGLTVLGGGKVSPGNSAGTLTVAGGALLTNATLNFELSNVTTPGAGVNDLISLSGGMLTLSGANVVSPTFLNGSLAVGTYTLISGGSSTVGSAANLSWGGPSGGRQTFGFDTATPGTVQLVVGGSPAGNLFWRGLVNTNWDLGTSNWLNGAAQDRFFNVDTVHFDDAGLSKPLVNFTANVAPATVTVAASGNYTFAGTSTLTGAGTLNKSGSGTLSILNPNSTFTGAVNVTGGTLSFEAAGATLGSGPVTLSGGGIWNFPPSSPAYFFGGTLTVPAGQSGTVYSPGLANGISGNIFSGDSNSVLYISSGVSFAGTTSAQFDGFTGNINILPGATLRFSANSSGNTYGSLNPTFIINGSLRPRNAGNTVRLGALSGSGSIEGPQSNGGSGNTTYIIGGNNLNVSFNGTISSNSAVPGSAVVLSKTGTGKLTLNGASTYTGGTTVSAGSLIVNNASGSGTGSGALTVATGATLGGTGRIGSATTLNDYATLAPGNNTGTLTFDGSLTLGEFTDLNFELGTSSDRVVCNGALSLDGVLNVTNGPGFGPGSYTLFTYNPANGFSYSGLSFDHMPSGYNYGISTSTPGQVNLIVTSTTPPSFNPPLYSGGNLILSGSGGAPGASYYMLTSTNVILPLATWQVVASNQFDGSGNFAYTNTVNASTPQRYFRLQVP